jgi:hypothetical protein
MYFKKYGQIVIYLINVSLFSSPGGSSSYSDTGYEDGDSENTSEGIGSESCYQSYEDFISCNAAVTGKNNRITCQIYIIITVHTKLNDNY